MVLATAAAVFFSVRSVALIVSRTRPLPFGDQWAFITRDYFSFIDGNYRFLDLFNQHAEHRIVTTKLVLFVDALWFDMSGVFAHFIFYGTLLLMAVVMAILITHGQERWRLVRVVIATIILLGLVWSICQFVNIYWPFQVGFAFVHLFVLVCYAALAKALTLDDPRRYVWLSIACIANLIGVYSMGSGFLAIVPAIAIALWLRKLDRVLILFLAFHALVLLAHFIGFRPRSYEFASWAAYHDFVVNFLGWFFGGWWYYQGPAGYVCLTFFLLFMAGTCWLSFVKKRKIDPAAGVLLALAFFVVLEALVAAVARMKFGMTPRYATTSIVFVTALIAFAWRATAWVASASARESLRTAILVATIIAMGGANVPRYDEEWQRHWAELDRAAFAFVNGIFPDEQLKTVYRASSIELPMKRLAALRLGHFSSTAHAYQPPLNSLGNLQERTWPQCRYKIETVRSSAWIELTGWAVEPNAPRGLDWILAFDTDGRLLGYTRNLTGRSEVRAAFSLDNDLAGFTLFLRRPASTSSASVVRLVALPQIGHPSGEMCEATVTLDRS